MIRFSLVTAAVSTIALVAACGGTEATVIPTPDSGTGNDSSTGNDSGTGNDSSTGNDSGISFPDAGIGDPKIVDITFADKCPAAVPCGGAVVGTWDYENACAEGVWDEAKKFCPTLGIKKQTGTVQGRIVFTPSTVSRAVKLTFAATLNLPAGCLQGVLTCQQIQTNLQKNFTTASCAAANGGCDCDVTTNVSGTSNGMNYTLAANQIVLSDGNKFDYCVKGSAMDYRWASGPNPEKASFVLKKIN